MLLVTDIGNTDTGLGIFQGEKLVHRWRVASDPRRTADELAVQLRMLFDLAEIRFEDLSHVAIASVVPALTQSLTRTCQEYLHQDPLVVGPGVKTGMPILGDNPREVGADRIVNAVAAYEEVKGASIIVDFGTATTFDYVSAKGEYVGGIIAPGIGVAAEALFSRTAKLPRVEVTRPESVIGRNTVHGIQSGLYYGYASMVDGLIERAEAELGHSVEVIGTGGLAGLIAPDAHRIDRVIEELTLQGLRLIYERNH
jgi:type III pantothenate kinase